MNEDGGGRREKQPQLGSPDLLVEKEKRMNEDGGGRREKQQQLGSSDQSLRAYSKKHRVYVLREFLQATFGDKYLAAGDVVLDIAGGKGDLSYILCNVDGIKSAVIDPRLTVNHIQRSVDFLRAHPEECKVRAVPGRRTYQPLAALIDKFGSELQKPDHLRIFVDQQLVDNLQAVVKNGGKKYNNTCLETWNEYWKAACARTTGFVTPTGKNDFLLASETPDSTSNIITDAAAALDLLLRARLVVGFHPDQATDYCFRLAKVLGIPYMVVPCCVFPSEFPNRRVLVNDDKGHIVEERMVKRYDDLIQYLKQENPNARTAMLSFPGTTTARNIVLYTLPTVDGA